VRRDLSPAQQLVQAAHACLEAGRHFLLPADEHPHLVILGAADELELQRACARLRAVGVDFQYFREPDLGNSLTAVATPPLRGAARRFFRRYVCLTPAASFQDSSGGVADVSVSELSNDD
jgi:hypothetical protein